MSKDHEQHRHIIRLEEILYKLNLTGSAYDSEMYARLRTYWHEHR